MLKLAETRKLGKQKFVKNASHLPYLLGTLLESTFNTSTCAMSIRLGLQSVAHHHHHLIETFVCHCESRQEKSKIDEI